MGRRFDYTRAIAITPNDSTNTPLFRAIRAVGAGNVVVDTPRETSVTIYIAAGGLVEMAIQRVRATGTTATGLVGHP